MSDPVVRPHDARPSPAVRLRRPLFELALIIVGVLIALAVDEWREQRDDSARAVSALGQLRLELEKNRELATAASKRHAETALAYQAALERLRTERRFERPAGELGNVESAPLTRSAYEALIVSGVATDLEPAALATIGRAYDADQQYRDLNGRYLSSILATDFRDGERYFQQMWFWGEALASEETALAGHHSAAIDAVDLESRRRR